MPVNEKKPSAQQRLPDARRPRLLSPRQARRDLVQPKGARTRTPVALRLAASTSGTRDTRADLATASQTPHQENSNFRPRAYTQYLSRSKNGPNQPARVEASGPTPSSAIPKSESKMKHNFAVARAMARAMAANSPARRRRLRNLEPRQGPNGPEFYIDGERVSVLTWSMQKNIPCSIFHKYMSLIQTAIEEEERAARLKECDQERIVKRTLEELENEEKERDPDQDQCRICHRVESTSVDPLLDPCQCAGTLRFVHFKCLEQWMRVRMMNVPGVLRYQQCELCKTDFRLDPILFLDIHRRAMSLMDSYLEDSSWTAETPPCRRWLRNVGRRIAGFFRRSRDRLRGCLRRRSHT